MKSCLFDIQVNGFAGVDFQQPGLTATDVTRAVEGLASHETQRFFLTLITDSIPSLCSKLENFESIRAMNPILSAAICGYHIEGPWLSPEPGYSGAHDPRFMGPPNLADLERLQKAAHGHIKLITLAPEWPKSASFIQTARAQGIHISLGHTNASENDIDAAVSAGALFCTHLGNGTPADLPRHDNIIQRLLCRDELTAFFIPDGIHIRPATLQSYFRAKPHGQALFTTDCMAAAGAPHGRFRIAHHEVEVGPDRVVRSPITGTLAGSALAPDEGVRNISTWLHLSEAEARSLFSTKIAQAFGIHLPTTTP